MHHILRFMACAGALALMACGSDGGSGDDGGEVDCDAADAPTYETFGESFIQTNCLGCHSASTTGAAGFPDDGLELETLEQVRALSSNIQAVAVETELMPQDGDVSDEERALLGAWLTCGAPE